MLPPVILGLVVCGLLSSQLSTISGNLNGVATLFTNDIYENLRKRKATDKEVLLIARIMTLLVGLFMIGFAFAVPIMGGAVEAYLTIIGIMDMPLFIVGILYGLLWKRATSRSAIIGYLAGALAGVIGKFGYGMDFNSTTFVSAGVALLVVPVVTLLQNRRDNPDVQTIWKAKSISEEEVSKGDIYHILPKSAYGRMSLAVYLGGLLLFIGGVISGSNGFPYASAIAVAGMVIYFLGGYLKVLRN
jgi:SSS family solute:Na+ symporter